MEKFEREEALVRYHLLPRLSWNSVETMDPKAAGEETGIDVMVRNSDGRTIGIQVTEIHPHEVPGLARGQEKKLIKTNPNRLYFMWGQNDSSTVVNAIVGSIQRKVKNAEKYLFDQYNEVWLLLCTSIPDAAASTLVMTSWLSADNLNSATDSVLRGSKYDRCFLLPILGAEQAFYSWDRASCWEKRVQLEDINQVPRDAYIDSLLKAGNQQERDQLCDEECLKLLSELRQT